MARAREPIADRITRSVSIVGECWLWMGSRGRDGYGVLTVGRKQIRAHRASYEAFHGPAGKMLVCHCCDVPLCVNPAHLFLGTPKENTSDMLAKGRKARVVDRDHPNTKISHADRQRVRKMRLSGMTLKAIAKEFGVSFQTVGAICSGARNYAAR